MLKYLFSLLSIFIFLPSIASASFSGGSISWSAPIFGCEFHCASSILQNHCSPHVYLPAGDKICLVGDTLSLYNGNVFVSSTTDFSFVPTSTLLNDSIFAPFLEVVGNSFRIVALYLIVLGSFFYFFSLLKRNSL